MIRRYKIVINPTTRLNPRPEINSNLVKSSNYLFYENSAVYPGLVNENNVFEYLSDPNNASVTNKFFKYLKKNLNKKEVQFLYSQANKIYPILNNYYQQKIRLNKEPSKFLLYESIVGAETVYYQDNNFDYKTKQRDNKRLSKLVQYKSTDTSVDFDSIDNSDVDNPIKYETTGQRFELKESGKNFFENYYINVKINKTQGPVLTTDYSEYLEDCVKDGVVLKNCFVNINKKIDPFEFWGDNAFRAQNRLIKKSTSFSRSQSSLPNISASINLLPTSERGENKNKRIEKK